jgi:putative flippase GtrA
MLGVSMIKFPSLERAFAHIGRARRIMLFVAVGCCAAAVHWGTVVWLVERYGWPPLLANLLAWCVALVVSFFGHYRLTFRDQNALMATAARRFVLVSGFGFLLNEMAYALLLQFGQRGYAFKLAAVLVAVAGLTYVLSRHWAFLRNAAD